ncbi:MAG: DUF4982 domain-containing protein [Bacteroidaceae bacterium]|nr:DUF4982 domain-containing protein [Bacteroidaceae bacterium]
MKTSLRALQCFCALCILTVLSAHAQQYERQHEQAATENIPFEQFAEDNRVLFNFDWHFTPGNPEGAERTDFDEAAWRKLDLPHDFQFEQPWGEEHGGARGFKPMCDGWYRKTFRAEAAWKGRQILLDFDGILYYSDVYVNGTKVASSEYGYCGFEADISRLLHYGADNVVAVYANTGKKTGSRWYTGGGIFRDVYLVQQNPTHIGRHGIFVTTPSVSDAQATVQVQADVYGFKKHETLVRAVVRDAAGKEVGRSETTPNQLTKHHHDEICLPVITLSRPHRWDIDSPYLYQVEVEVVSDGVVVDRQHDRFGIRTLEFSPQFGFKLNGRKLFLKGMANHHDMGALGAAAFESGIERQLRLMKSFGYNSIRCSHNPYSAALTRLCDEIGLLVVDELIDKWSDNDYWGGRKPFMQLWPGLIEEWITRDRNCPSVVLWSLGNELQTRPDWSGYDTNDWGITTYRIFDQMVKRYDPTRLTTVAQFPARAGAIREEKEFKTYFAPPELGCATEVNSFNYQWDCYPKYFEYCPDLILYQSEAVTNQLQAPFYGMDRDRTVGLAYWGAIEYWGESNKWPKKGWNYSFFSHTLQPYPQAWLIRGAFVPEEPVVRIGILTGSESLDWNDVNVGQKAYTSFWNFRKGNVVPVTVFTNAQEVELLLNGRSLGRQQNDTTDVFKRGILLWKEVPFEPGNLTAVAYTEGREVARHRIETAGQAVALRLEAEQGPWKADGMDLQYIAVRAVDSKGRVVPGYNESLMVEVDGAASFLAMDNADHYTDLLFHDVTTKPMRQGYMLIILRSQRHAGKVTLKVRTPQLKGTLKLATQ